MIREATPADVARIVEMGTRFVSDTTYRAFLTINPSQMAVFVARLIDGPASVIFVAERNGALLGMIGMLIFPHHMSGDLIAAEAFWWVEPEARGAGVRLLKTAEGWALTSGAKFLQMVAPTDRVGQLYERRGYARVETSYQRSLQ